MRLERSGGAGRVSTQIVPTARGLRFAGIAALPGDLRSGCGEVGRPAPRARPAASAGPLTTGRDVNVASRALCVCAPAQCKPLFPGNTGFGRTMVCARAQTKAKGQGGQFANRGNQWRAGCRVRTSRCRALHFIYKVSRRNPRRVGNAVDRRRRFAEKIEFLTDSSLFRAEHVAGEARE